jgi:hypothetical protein
MATTQRERHAAQARIQHGMDALARRRAIPVFG